MLDIDKWMHEYIKAVKNVFKDRIICIGLQGSYGRGEAGESSDIDVVLILDTLIQIDLAIYRNTIEALREHNTICGFISDKKTLINWEASDLFQFYNDTVIMSGSLDFLLPYISKENAQQAIKTGACNIYHCCVHNMVHDRSVEMLKANYKSAVFVLQAIVFLRDGKYIRRHDDLSSSLNGMDSIIMQKANLIKSVETMDSEAFDDFSGELFVWLSELISNRSRGFDLLNEQRDIFGYKL